MFRSQCRSGQLVKAMYHGPYAKGNQIAEMRERREADEQMHIRDRDERASLEKTISVLRLKHLKIL